MTYRHIIAFALLLLLDKTLLAVDFPLLNGRTKAQIYYDPKQPKLDSISATLLARDIALVTGYQPRIITDLSKATGPLVIIGSIHSPAVQQILPANSPFSKNLSNQWECFGWTVISRPLPNVSQALVIAGSDARGTAYGVFSISEKTGVSPWYWWADVAPEKKKKLVLSLPDFTSAPPSVKFRGIFINDEDWGLLPWASHTFEPETGNIGPRTYSRVFELLLRLKANLLWPAMHPGTTAFFLIPGNRKMAEDFGIVIGSSHAEPMLRNNVDEWKPATMGAFNYITNKNSVLQYWEERIKESSTQNTLFTLGMRGIHDSGMEGIKNPKEAVPLLEQIISEQRKLLSRYRKDSIHHIPQTFTIYKEVLDIYDNGLKLPDDVMITWPDDNYGYIQRLNTPAEKQRKGGSGVYYHASYWGRPHDYLWLSSTHPALIREEMMKAYNNQSNQIWVLNVGDIKPLEYNIQLFMDMAFNAVPFQESEFCKQHLTQWAGNIFGTKNATNIQRILWEYYQLAFERRPEFMGWSQTEPITPVKPTGYHHFLYGDEAAKRMNRYHTLEQAALQTRQNISTEQQDAFYQLVFYPVRCAALMNRKFLYRDKAWIYQSQQRANAVWYAQLSEKAYDSIALETDLYNQLKNGKWKGIMSMAPRKLPVFSPPPLPAFKRGKSDSWSMMAEGRTNTDSTERKEMSLPTFSKWGNESFFLDLFLCDSTPVEWAVSTSSPWVNFSQRKGVLTGNGMQAEKRIWVNIDWKKTPAAALLQTSFEISGGGKTFSISVSAVQPPSGAPVVPEMNMESNGMVSIFAHTYSRLVNKPYSRWNLQHNMGHTGSLLQAEKDASFQPMAQDGAFTENAFAEYDFHLVSDGPAQISFYTWPTHPENTASGMRYAISIDGKKPVVVDFKTVGRSEEWKQHVLRNSAIKTMAVPHLGKGSHTLRIYAIDAGVLLERILLQFNALPAPYSVVPQVRNSAHKGK